MATQDEKRAWITEIRRGRAPDMGRRTRMAGAVGRGARVAPVRACRYGWVSRP